MMNAHIDTMNVTGLSMTVGARLGVNLVPDKSLINILNPRPIKNILTIIANIIKR